jgi:hypothetical protein
MWCVSATPITAVIAILAIYVERKYRDIFSLSMWPIMHMSATYKKVIGLHLLKNLIVSGKEFSYD